MQKQSEIIKQLSDKQLTIQLYMSQGVIFFTAIILSLFLFEDFSRWWTLFDWQLLPIIYYGVGSGLVVVALDIVLMKVFPSRYYDDGGINQRIFQNRSVISIFTIASVVAISEEVLFRGVLQTTLGYVIASTLFALVHIRYLSKPVLFVSILFVSFFIGYIYELTANLWVCIIAHFTVDFLLGLLIRFRKWGAFK
ncbi:CPBP family intramembrane glutamic endopeptidase [Lentibacillus saliphilus]|uniref:CPBP family intramembrane glutamic endopeptidase n=1 Tax=Lentibacillus saliphilus TaxID=2737028 RepID=UPI001C30904C|nr:CPBP family intramembrane glutamic endopeptidase [Lentibacillus saliphilus]